MSSPAGAEAQRRVASSASGMGRVTIASAGKDDAEAVAGGEGADGKRGPGAPCDSGATREDVVLRHAANERLDREGQDGFVGPVRSGLSRMAHVLDVGKARSVLVGLGGRFGVGVDLDLGGRTPRPGHPRGSTSCPWIFVARANWATRSQGVSKLTSQRRPSGARTGRAPSRAP